MYFFRNSRGELVGRDGNSEIVMNGVEQKLEGSSVTGTCSNGTITATFKEDGKINVATLRPTANGFIGTMDNQTTEYRKTGGPVPPLNTARPKTEEDRQPAPVPQPLPSRRTDPVEPKSRPLPPPTLHQTDALEFGFETQPHNPMACPTLSGQYVKANDPTDVVTFVQTPGALKAIMANGGEVEFNGVKQTEGSQIAVLSICSGHQAIIYFRAEGLKMETRFSPNAQGVEVILNGPNGTKTTQLVRQ